MRRDVNFISKGSRCVGWLYVPDDLDSGSKAPAVVMAHGFSGVKESYLSNFAEKFVESGFVTLVFDYRYLGESEGEPRGQIIWYEQIEDYRNAVTWISQQPEVNPDKIGVWGTSYSGAHVLHVGAYDKRIKAVVSQVQGGINPWDTIMNIMGADGFARFLDFLMQDRIARYKTGEVNYMKVVAPAGEPCVLSAPGAYEFFMGEHLKMAPNWRNRVTMESLEKMIEYDLTSVLPRISPTPLLMVLAEHDPFVPVDLAEKAFELSLEPKRLSILPCDHFDVYENEEWLLKATGEAVDWFKKYLV